jgi:uncharacterized membrane protein YphA (DoxX/SURF4 family)
MKNKTQRIISTVLLALPILTLIISGILKIFRAEPQQVMEFLIKAGFAPHLTLLGLTQIVIAALLIYPKTRKIGFLLACCYFGGALSVEISGAQAPASAVFLVILWIGMFLRDRAMFLPGAVEQK